MTTTATVSTLSLTNGQWRALDSHRATKRTRYALEYVGWFAATDASRALLGSDGVACATDGKRAIFLPAPAPSTTTLAAIPKTSKARKAQSDVLPAATLPDGSESRYFPPALDVLPSVGEGMEIPVDSLRALFAPFAVDPENDTVRCWFGAGIRLAQRSPLTDVNVSATWGNAPSDDRDPIDLGAAYVLSACDAAAALGVKLVTVRAKDPRSAVTFGLAGKGLALVMPRVLA